MRLQLPFAWLWLCRHWPAWRMLCSTCPSHAFHFYYSGCWPLTRWGFLARKWWISHKCTYLVCIPVYMFWTFKPTRCGVLSLDLVVLGHLGASTARMWSPAGLAKTAHGFKGTWKRAMPWLSQLSEFLKACERGLECNEWRAANSIEQPLTQCMISA